MYLGHQIYKHRRALNWTQDGLGKKVGKNQSTISRIEKNEVEIHEGEFQLFAQSLGISVEDLLAAAESPVSPPVLRGEPPASYDNLRQEVQFLHEFTQSMLNRMNAMAQQIGVLTEHVKAVGNRPDAP